MHSSEGLAILDRLLPYTLNNLQQQVFCAVWDNKTYAAIAQELSYEHSYIRDIGFKLWQQLSAELGQKISKSNVRAVLSRYARANNGMPSGILRGRARDAIAFPSGPVSLGSEFYIERQPYEARVLAEVLKPGSLVQLIGPCQGGKTSLLNRILDNGQAYHLRCVKLSLCQADQTVLSSWEQFLRWFCANLSSQLKIPIRLNAYWNTDIGSTINCTTYIHDYVLQICSGPLLIAIDDMQVLGQTLLIDLFSLLQTWYEAAKMDWAWQNVRWAIAYRPSPKLDLLQSQFCINLGYCYKLPELSLEQVQTLVQAYGLPELDGEYGEDRLQRLLHLVGGNPGRITLALYQVRQRYLGIETLLTQPDLLLELYREHLEFLWSYLILDPALKSSLAKILRVQSPIDLPFNELYALESLGMIRRQGHQAAIACDLYRHAFSSICSSVK